MTTGYEFKKVQDEFYPKIVKYLTGMVGLNEAEDVAQDVFEKISRKLDDFEEGPNYRPGYIALLQMPLLIGCGLHHTNIL